MMTTAVNTLIFACAGVAFEVVFTGLTKYIKERDPRLMGKSYIWMFPIYALAYPLLFLIYPLLEPWPLFVRGGLYVLILYAIEYSTGWLIKRLTKACPWDYGSARWAVHGYIRLDYAPVWLAVVLAFERLFLYLPH